MRASKGQHEEAGRDGGGSGPAPLPKSKGRAMNLGTENLPVGTLRSLECRGASRRKSMQGDEYERAYGVKGGPVPVRPY